MNTYLIDVTDHFWKFVNSGHYCNSGDELKKLECYNALNKFIDTTCEKSLLFVKHSSMFPDTSKKIRLPSIMQRMVFGDEVIYVFPDIHEVFHGVRHLLLLSHNEKAVYEVGKCIFVMESYIDMQNIIQGVSDMDLEQ